MTVSQAYTDNALGQTSGKRSADFITQINPYVSVHGDTPRVSMDLYYAPFATIYAKNSNQTGFGQNLNARAHAMIVEDRAYIDMFAFAGLFPALGGINTGIGGPPINGNPGTNIGNDRQSLSQVYSFGVTPYAIQRFGGWGTGKIGLSAQASSSGASSYANGTGTNTKVAASNSQSLQGTAQFTSGENLGRFQSQTVVSSQLGTGTGASRNSSDYVAQTTLTYAVTRWAAVFGMIGYEAISYQGTTTPYKSSDPIWSAGTRFNFGEDGYAAIGYGQRYGTNSVQFEGAYSLTARTRISGRYWTGFGTELQLLQANLATSGIDQYGASVNLDTGAPIFLNSNGLGGGNQNLYRTQNLNATLTSVILDDPVSIGVQITDQTLVASSGTAAAFPNKSVSVTASWSHSFTELLGGGVYVVYTKSDVQGLGTANSPINGKETSIATTASLSYTFSPTLTGSARYTYYDQSSNVQFRSYSQNLVMISLSKQF